jgi:hypothetical protein
MILSLVCGALDARANASRHYARVASRTAGMQSQAGANELDAEQCDAITAKLRGADPVHLRIALEWLGMADPDHVPRMGPGAPEWRLPSGREGQNGG